MSHTTAPRPVSPVDLPGAAPLPGAAASPVASPLSPGDVCDVVGGMLRQMERVGDEDVGVVVAALGGMLRVDRRGGRFARLGWMLEDCAEAMEESAPSGCEVAEVLR